MELENFLKTQIEVHKELSNELKLYVDKDDLTYIVRAVSRWAPFELSTETVPSYRDDKAYYCLTFDFKEEGYRW